MTQGNIKPLLITSISILFGVILIAFLVEPGFQFIKTGSKEVFLEETRQLFTIRRGIIWIAISVILANYRVKQKQKQIVKQSDQDIK